MVTKGLLVRLDAKAGKHIEVENFLRSALTPVRQEPGTTAWFAIRFGRGEYGIFDVFPDDAARDAHLAGPVARSLMAESDVLLESPPRIQKLDVLASRIDERGAAEPPRKGLLLTFKGKAGNEHEVENFLRDAQTIVQDEPKTLAWFAIRLETGEYGIFDVFPDNGARFAHLAGHVPRELAKHALSLLGGMPDIEMLDVLEDKMAP